MAGTLGIVTGVGVLRSGVTCLARMRGQNGQLITDVQQLSLAIKALKERAKNPNAQTSAGQAINSRDLSEAIRIAEEGLAQVSQPFREGMQEFRDYTNQVLRPQTKGPIGSLMDNNPVTAGQTPVSRLNGMVENNSPQTIRNTVRQLADPIMTGGQTVTPAEIARALYQQKLARGSQTPGKTVRGEPGSLNDEKLQTLIEASGGNPAQVTQPLRAADNLKMDAAGSVNGLPEMLLRQAVFRPFRTLDMMMTGKTQADINHELARLLAGPVSREQIDALRRIAMFDPNVRRMLTARAAGQPLLNPGE